MINKLIEEINIALDNNLYYVALSVALTLPDICGKAEYPKLNTTKRYKRWYQQYIGQYEQCPEEKEINKDFPYLSDNVVYQLRCSVLHQGNPNVEKENTGIDKFILVKEKKDEFCIYTDIAIVDCDNLCKKTYKLSVRRICSLLCETAKNYYIKNQTKFNFFNYEIVDFNDFIKE